MEDDEVSIQRSKDRKKIEMQLVSQGNNAIPTPSESRFCSVCVFSGEADTISESTDRRKSITKLSGLIVFYVMVMLVEIIGGVKANSLAVMTDAAHLLTDVAGFSVSLFTVRASAWAATPHQSFGYGRLEVLGALLSVQLIWFVSALLIYEAVDRVVNQHDKVNGALMFAVAAFGFCVNLVMVLWLGHDHTHHACRGTDDHRHRSHRHRDRVTPSDLTEDEEDANLVPCSSKTNKILNINLQGAYLHVMADLIQSVGVMIAGAVIWMKPEWLIVDLLCTFVFSTFALSTTLPMLRDIFSILMERTPRDIDVKLLESGIKGINGVHNIHDLHIWAVTVGKLVLSCHVEAEPGTSSGVILREIREYCEKTYEIRHLTIQME